MQQNEQDFKVEFPFFYEEGGTTPSLGRSET